MPRDPRASRKLRESALDFLCRLRWLAGGFLPGSDSEPEFIELFDGSEFDWSQCDGP